jgi:integrase
MASTNRLTARAVIAAKKLGLHADGGGLYLQVTKSETGAVRRSWVFRFTAPDQRRREMGLGRLDRVSLAQARAAAETARRLLGDGTDPIESRRAERARRLTQDKPLTFRQCAEAYVAAHADQWRNAKHRWQWTRTLEMFAYPAFGDLPVKHVDVDHVLKALEPIWAGKNETASRLRGRIEAILDWAAVRKLRSGDNPARWRGHLEKALPPRRKDQSVRHFPALPYAEIAAFMADLRARPRDAARALEFCILTATRSVETRGARWDEIDLDAGVWNVPAERMKMKRQHRVPLAPAAVALLRGSPRRSAFVFPSARGDKLNRPGKSGDVRVEVMLP